MGAFLFLAFSALLGAGASQSPLPRRDSSLLPLSADDGWILDADGNRFPFVGVNWPGHEEAMFPEGLQYQSIADIVSKVAETGFNSVRLTFATEMVDDILDKGGDVTLKATLSNVLGAENGTRILDRIIEHNPSFDADTTRLEVFDAVAAELDRQGILLHLDNHVSKAGWCCALDDGNGWWGDTHFNASSWVRGLSYMASHGADHWPSFSSIGLRNELRHLPAGSAADTLEPTTWQVWKDRMLEAADAVHEANPDVLIFFSGKLFDFDLSAPVLGKSPTEKGFNFSVAELSYKDKFVFEQHQYDQGQVGDTCDNYYVLLELLGSGAPTAPADGNRAPLVMSEWGHAQADERGKYNGSFHRCLVDYMSDNHIGWMLWVLGGSHYIREGVQDEAEPWGILDHSWDSYRGTESIKQLKLDMKGLYEAYNQSMPEASPSSSETESPSSTASPTGEASGTGSSEPEGAGVVNGAPVLLALGAALLCMTAF